MRYNATVTKTADGLRQYLQVMSEDSVSTNIVLVADEFVVIDLRGAPVTEGVQASEAEVPRGGFLKDVALYAYQVGWTDASHGRKNAAMHDEEPLLRMLRGSFPELDWPAP